jgi:hypothetical protein
MGLDLSDQITIKIKIKINLVWVYEKPKLIYNPVTLKKP